eukprot:TRINITY_DN4266_c5_g1_i1.p1 TRINITY_DN4266_c5_g1~~TRINITY_DN4266_c5_g1_i1.p1  ORF type:complete len:507 (+),score=133.57 TRINITY_DN4266_c5_g1_i1:97-1521(+)
MLAVRLRAAASARRHARDVSTTIAPVTAEELRARDPSLVIPAPVVSVVRNRRGTFNLERHLRESLGMSMDVPRNERVLAIAQQLFKKGHKWTDAAASVSHQPPNERLMPEVAFIGRRRSGKSRMIRCLLGTRNVTRYPSLAGQHKNVMNFYSVGRGCMRIIDTPGWGWVQDSEAVQRKWQNAVLALLQHRPMLKRIYLFADPRSTGFTERDATMLEWLTMNAAPVTLVVSKADKWLTGVMNRDRKNLSMEENYQSLLRAIRAMKDSLDLPAARDVPVLITSAKMAQGIGEMIYDITSHACRDLADSDLYLEDVGRGMALGPAESSETAVVPAETHDTGAVLSPCSFLPPLQCPEGFFYDPTVNRSIGDTKLILRTQPRKDGGALAMKPDWQAMSADHPLKGTQLLRRYFPTLAEDYMRRNHAALNPTVKAEVEQKFGFKVPKEVADKFLTPDEKEVRRQRALAALRSGKPMADL